jgi:hypothetical protein
MTQVCDQGKQKSVPVGQIFKEARLDFPLGDNYQGPPDTW